MRLFVCEDHAYFWSVGVCSIVAASSEVEASELLKVALRNRGLNENEPFTLQEINMDEPMAYVIRDGNY